MHSTNQIDCGHYVASGVLKPYSVPLYSVKFVKLLGFGSKWEFYLLMEKLLASVLVSRLSDFLIVW